MNRRGFLDGILAAGMAPAIVKAESVMKLWTPALPFLYSDGIHDDTLALQARIDRGVRTGRLVCFENGVFRISSALVVPATASLRIVGCEFRSDHIGVKVKIRDRSLQIQAA